jgi:DnaK suppressor protein
MSEAPTGQPGRPEPGPRTEEISGAAVTRDIARLDEIGSELAAVDTTLRRLDDGSYGTCEVCGRRLDADMLEADVLSTRCAAHRG